jgi:hypothetical protein
MHSIINYDLKKRPKKNAHILGEGKRESGVVVVGEEGRSYQPRLHNSHLSNLRFYIEFQPKNKNSLGGNNSV